MEMQTQRTDRDARVNLFHDFADELVILKRISDDEIRIVKAKATRKRYSLAELVEKITPESLHEEIDTGPSVGAEEW